MRLNIRYSSILPMLDIIKEIKQKHDVETKLDQLLKHKDYQFEFERYKKQITKEEYKHYLLHCQQLKEEDITNQNFKVHHNYYVDLFNRTEYYYEKYNDLKTLVTPELLNKSLHLAKAGLPKEIDINEIDFIFTIGIGMSFGYVFKDCSHYDFLTLSKEITYDDFFNTLAHEIHHICMNQIFPTEFKPLELFLLFFAGEGLAVKYCNNATGVLSKSIYSDKKVNIGLDPFSWDYLNNQFDEAFSYFKNTLKQIKNKHIKTTEEVERIIQAYFMNALTNEQEKTEKPKLKQFLLYSLGNDLYGIIHDVFGKEKVFEVIKNPNIFVETFNQAVKAINKPEYVI